ncbi:iron-containing alcohol dehydrogenase [Flagellimonas sp. CMM7]|uniref:iron-containing alcohol dehydrogenase n=1 Tax=Flagellimonas sp. CMM7 TaxID=2654676 RepID=UPI0013D81781|nr:iron-containing alcohol dehydrogenase [Flagellimonas sp. CMM7]UII79877.1 iron-containing alcohol dehydrogenase [Flagellimonas sp. CMM7]
MKSFRYHQPTEIIFGTGKVQDAGEIVKKYGDRCLVVTTPAIEATKPMYDRVIQILKDAGVAVAHYDQVIPNPTTEVSAAGAKLALEHKADVILGLGGGSSMDAAKAIAVEASHEGSAWDYLFYKKQPTKKTLPVISVSTTSGTGSQVTQVSVITNTEERDKSALYHPLIFPAVCIVDPELMTTLPNFITAPTGFDVFCHAFESAIHPGRGAYIDLLAWEAIEHVVTYLPKVLEEPKSIEYREKMAWADTLAGLCIASAGVTLPHGMGMAIGGMYPHVAHGEALAIVYPACTRFTAISAPQEYGRMAKLMDSTLKDLSNEEAAKHAEEAIVKFLKKIGMYKKLSDVNMPENDIEALAQQCMVLPDYENNPKVATKNEMIELVKASY